MRKKTLFPKRLYVYRDGDGDGVFFIAHPSLGDLPDENQPIGIYELAETRNLAITKELK